MSINDYFTSLSNFDLLLNANITKSLYVSFGFSQLVFFVLFTIQRSLSGIQNYFGYSYSNLNKNPNETNHKAQNKLKMMWITTMGLLFITLSTGMSLSIGEHKFVTSNFLNILSIVLTIVSFLSCIFLANSFYDVLKVKFIDKDIHKWETIITGALMIVGIISGVNFFYLFVSVLLGMVIHKGFINLAFNLPFLHKKEITDDLTGKTYNIPSLNLTIKRLITNGQVRLFLAVIGTLLVLVNEFYFKVNFDIRTIVNWFN